MKIHPLALKVPAQTPEEFERLCSSVARGFDTHRKIITHDDMILDGRHREKACDKTGTKAHYEKWRPAFKGDSPELFVLRSTFHRDMSQGQRAALAVELLPQIEATQRAELKKPPVRPAQKVAQAERAPESAEIAAKAVGTNRAYVQAAKAIKEESPATFRQLKSGDISMTEAKKVLLKPPVRPKKLSAAEEALAAAPTFKELVNRTNALRRDIEALAKTKPGAELAKVLSRIQGNCKVIASDLAAKTPHAACPLGQSCEAGCKQCHGQKWLSADVYEALPKELKR